MAQRTLCVWDLKFPYPRCWFGVVDSSLLLPIEARWTSFYYYEIRSFFWRDNFLRNGLVLGKIRNAQSPVSDSTLNCRLATQDNHAWNGLAFHTWNTLAHYGISWLCYSDSWGHVIFQSCILYAVHACHAERREYKDVILKISLFLIDFTRCVNEIDIQFHFLPRLPHWWHLEDYLCFYFASGFLSFRGVLERSIERRFYLHLIAFQLWLPLDILHLLILRFS